MSGTPLREAPGWRWVQTRQGDTLPRIALREMGDAARWTDLASLNDLLPPYLTGDPDAAAASGGRVLLYGQSIRIFAASVQANAADSPDEVYGVDLALDAQGQLVADEADLSTVSGLANLAGALSRRITTSRHELLFHPDYGSRVRENLGRANTPARAAMAGRSAQAALVADPRVQEVLAVTAAPEGDRLAITATVRPIASGASFAIRTEV
jgi:phage baseplate assembly protein W